MTQQEIQAAIVQALSSLSGVEGVSQSMIDAAATNATSVINTAHQAVIEERDTAVSSLDETTTSFDSFKEETRSTRFNNIATALKITPAKLIAFKAYMTEDEINAITDIKTAKAAFAKAAKDSEGTITFDGAAGVNNQIKQTASPFEIPDESDPKKETTDVSEEAVNATDGAGLGS